MIHVLSSGSKGNSYCIETADDLIFIDMGITVTTFRKFVSTRKGKKISIFITHEHTDHICGLAKIAERYQLNIYTSKSTSEYLCAKEGISKNLIYSIATGMQHEIGGFAIEPFNIQHDAVEPFGYLIMTDSGNVGIATDLGCISDYQLSALKCADTIILEANYDTVMLKNGPYPSYLKKRVASLKGHLSNSDAMSAIAQLAGTNIRQCLFAHVSENNNDYQLLDKLALFALEQYGIKTSVLRQKTEYTFNIIENVPVAL